MELFNSPREEKWRDEFMKYVTDLITKQMKKISEKKWFDYQHSDQGNEIVSLFYE